jgi:putative transposase
MLEYRSKGNCRLHDFVLMPNHLPLILTPAEDVTLENARQWIKGGSSQEIHKVRGNKMQIWQPGFHESRVTDPMNYRKKADSIRFNPGFAKLVERPEDWSSSVSAQFERGPIPQGLKPVALSSMNAGPNGPTPNLGSKSAGT